MDGTSSHPDCLIMQVYNSSVPKEVVNLMKGVTLDFVWIGECCIYFHTIDVFIASRYDYGILCIVVSPKIEL